MQPLTSEWIAKAEGDYATMLREVRARKSPNYDAACFHAQQCVEKYFKAQLQEYAISFTKTHNLVALLGLLLADHPDLEAYRSDLSQLTSSAVEVRYPGEDADRSDAKEAARICRQMRSLVRQSLGIEQ